MLKEKCIRSFKVKGIVELSVGKLWSQVRGPGINHQDCHIWKEERTLKSSM